MPPAPPAETPVRASATSTAEGPATPTCPSSIDVASVLRAHAEAYGSPRAVANATPFTLRMDVTVEKKTGSYELVLGRDETFRSEQSVSGIYGAAGKDRAGFWSLGIAGVLTALEADEAQAPAFDAWLARRAYVDGFDGARDAASCVVRGRPRIVLRYIAPHLGNPELVFDYLTFALVSASAESADGGRGNTTFESWTLPNARGIRFPRDVITESPIAARTVRRMVQESAGLACKGVDEAYASADCLARPTPKLVFEWPAGPVHVPMRNYLGEVSLEATIEGRKTWALLDSGAGLSAVDASTPAGRAFKTSLEVTGSGSSQVVRLGLGELDALRLGDLTLRHLPIASVPIPALEDFGARRPEIIVGYSLFAGAAVRVDYARSELVVARSAEGLVKPGATAVPLRVWEGKLVTLAEVEGVTAPMVLDTGSSGGLDFRKYWADAHGIPGARKIIELRARSGAGEAATVGTLFRLGQARLGPIRHDDRLAQIDDPPGKNRLAGLLGNEILGHCPAVVFDAARRTLWLEGPCNRTTPEALAGWRLTKKDDKQQPDRPWVIETVLPGSAAQLAGLVPGDRLLVVGGVAATLDLPKVQAQVEKAPGTRVQVEYETITRDRRKVTLELRRVLSP